MESEIETIRKEISKILGNVKLEPHIHSIVKELYAEYQNAYIHMIEYLKNKYPNKEKGILRLEIDTLSDYKEDIKMVETIELEEYEQRRLVIIEVINKILKSVNKNKDISRESFHNDMSDILKEKHNETYAKIVIQSTISEIESSSKYLLNKINYLGIKQDEELQIMEQQFIAEIRNIREQAIRKAPEVAQIIGDHFKDIYQQLENVVERYKKQIAQEESRDDER